MEEQKIHYPQYYGEDHCTVHAAGWYTPEQSRGDENYWFSSRVWFSKTEDKSDLFIPKIKDVCDELKRQGVLRGLSVITIMPGHEWGRMSITLHRVAVELSSYLKVPYVQILERSRKSQPNHRVEGKKLHDRYTDTHGSLAVKTQKIQSEWEKVLLLDDVKTTGISIMEARQVLFATGITDVVSVCFAINK